MTSISYVAILILHLYDIKLDYSNLKNLDNNKKSRNCLSTVINNRSLIDTFRLFNGDVNQYT